ncbi:zf-HC2 domain-containing protein [Anabaena cylindrica UHCC 0172]|uniref:anti-sigma factor family protein n=1 Tax=Anabaena cylindrica TaxID=1165 RepID=UPI002B1FD7E2|nr:zf-HC2 domain-containing protein [Anabaena cylindrica]MEA5553173.1 zf-HC2 domain-containing protein [Anabaena cylindrica UHCC 0172]
MNTDSQFYDRSHSQLPSDVSDGMANHTNESTGAMDRQKRDSLRHSEADRFELLSAYLDGEVTAVERRQVEEWLANDNSVKCLYQRLLKLRQGLKTIPLPEEQNSAEETFQQVWKRLRCRSQLTWMVGSAAAAACVIGTISGLIPGSGSKMQFAQQQIQPIAATTQPAVPTSPLMVALNNPVIEIPKTAIASPKKLINQSETPVKDTKLDIN